LIDAVDPFIGTDVTRLAPAQGLAATWWWPKPQVGNTHPGATSPFGMVSACAYSGAYPTGYGVHDMNTEGVPTRLLERHQASGFTHFQQSGTGAIRKYYNYFRVTPMLDPLDLLDERWDLLDEVASPGYYATTLGNGIRSELTVGPKSAVHRYTFPEHRDSRIVIDFSLGGLAIEHGRTVPMRARLEATSQSSAQGEIVVEGVPLAVHLEWDAPRWRQMLWYDRRLMAGGSRLEFDSIRLTTLRPFGLMLMGPTESGEQVELRLGFSLRGVEQATANLSADLQAARVPDSGRHQHDEQVAAPTVTPTFDLLRGATEASWRDHLDRVVVEGATGDRRTVFATALYHSLIKPCFAPDESPFWSTSRAFVFDISTMWDLYKTQLPLVCAIAPERAVDLVTALLSVKEEEGNFPIGYRMARGTDRFFRQASALAHTFFADVAAAGLGGIDWEYALVHLHDDLRRYYGEDFLEKGIAHPVTHTLDLAYGYHCTGRIARMVGDVELAEHLDELAGRWVNAFDPSTGLLVDSTFYEGGRWNYSFRLLHDMAARIELAGGEDRFCEMLDRFFGYGQGPVTQPGVRPGVDELAAGYALDRFEGLNNEPDMEAPWAYHYVGRPDRTAEVVHAALCHAFGVGRGGLPGNDDSGGLSSWYVWASLGLFPVAGQSLFLINAPSFDRVQLRVPGGDVVVEAHGGPPAGTPGAPRYVASVTLDGEPLERTWLRGSELHGGCQLSVELTDAPTRWGHADRPPSSPTSHLDPHPFA
jgi:putative alpha-1,2-mannosidase